MDITETYIKMADCEEIQGLWKPSEGDWVIERRYLGLPAYPSVLLGGLRDGTFIVAVGWEENDYLDEEGAIWLPTQSQLQNMIIEYWWGNGKPGNWLSVLLQKFNWWLNDTLPESTSMEQLWIAFYMHEHNKIWVGDKWVKEEK